MTDKAIMEEYWNNIVKDLRNAEDKLDDARRILNDALAINIYGYCSDKLKTIKEDLHEFRTNANDRILPAIRKL